MTLSQVLSREEKLRFVSWKARRRALLLEACLLEFGPLHCSQEWYDFCEREYRRYLSGEISGRKYVRSRHAHR